MILFLPLMLFACESKPKKPAGTERQEKALTYVQSILPARERFVFKGYGPSIVLDSWADTSVKKAFRETVEFDMKNRFGVVEYKKAIIVFNEKDSVIHEDVIDRK